MIITERLIPSQPNFYTVHFPYILILTRCMKKKKKQKQKNFTHHTWWFAIQQTIQKKLN